MTIILKPKKAKPTVIQSDFTMEQLEKFFKVDNWYEFYRKHERKLWKENVNFYEWICYPCIKKDDEGFYRCMIHEQVIAKTGDKKPYTFFLKNINFASLVGHMLDYEPEKHKEYIKEKLFPDYNE